MKLHVRKFSIVVSQDECCLAYSKTFPTQHYLITASKHK